MTVKEENGGLCLPFHILSVGGRKARPQDQGELWWVLMGRVGGQSFQLPTRWTTKPCVFREIIWDNLAKTD